MADDPKQVVPPPRSDRIVYYLTGRVPSSARGWAEHDVLSGRWVAREWIRVAVTFVVLLGITVIFWDGSVGWRTVIVAGALLTTGRS